MPDGAEVEQGLAEWIARALYPEGPGADSAVGAPCRVYRGWPLAATLEADLHMGIAHLVVQPVKDSARDTTRYVSSEWQGVVPPCALLAEVAGEGVRFTGAAEPGTVAGVRVDGRAYAFRVKEHSTPGVVAAVLAAMVRVDRPATLSGGTVRFPGGIEVLARAVADAPGGQEVRRQEAQFRVALWCPSPEARDRVAAFVDLSLAGLAFLDVKGWGCRIQSAGGSSSDEGAAVRAWRRDLLYRVEYPTVLETSLPVMLFGSGTVNTAPFVA